MDLLGLLNSGASLFNGYLNYKNYKQERETYNYQKDLQQDIFSREDNAQLRSVMDLKRAGLSPTLAAGNGASSGQAINVTNPEMRAINMAANLAALQSAADIDHTKAETDALNWNLKTSQDLGIRTSDTNALAKISAYSTLIDKIFQRRGEISNTFLSGIKSIFDGIFNGRDPVYHQPKSMPEDSMKKIKDYGYTNPTDLRYIYK